MTPTTRAEFKEYVLRKLGKPVIEINISDEQVEDRIDEALKYYYDYHFDGTEKIYYKHPLTAQDIQNQYIAIPENVIGIINIFDIGGMASSTSNMFNIQYQIALNDMYSFINTSLVPYWMAFNHLALIQEILVGKQPLRYNRHTNRLYIDMNWDGVNEGDYVIAEAYQVLDPETFPNVWGDRWLQRYTAALIKKQWGSNTKKFSGMQLPGGVTFNGTQIYQEAEEEIEKMEEEMLSSYSLPSAFIVGAIACLMLVPYISGILI